MRQDRFTCLPWAIARGWFGVGGTGGREGCQPTCLHACSCQNVSLKHVVCCRQGSTSVIGRPTRWSAAVAQRSSRSACRSSMACCRATCTTASPTLTARASTLASSRRAPGHMAASPLLPHPAEHAVLLSAHAPSTVLHACPAIRYECMLHISIWEWQSDVCVFVAPGSSQ